MPAIDVACVCLLVITVPMTSHILEQQAATNYEAI